MPSSGHGRTPTSAPAAPAAAGRPPAKDGAAGGPPGSAAGVAPPSAAAAAAAAAPSGGAVCGRAPPEAEAEGSADCRVPDRCRCRCRCSCCCVSASCRRPTASARAVLPNKGGGALRVVASGGDTWNMDMDMDMEHGHGTWTWCEHGASMVRAWVRSAPEEAPVGAGTRKRARARVPSVAAAGQLSSRLSRKRARGSSCAQRRRRPCEGGGGGWC